MTSKTWMKRQWRRRSWNLLKIMRRLINPLRGVRLKQRNLTTLLSHRRKKMLRSSLSKQWKLWIKQRPHQSKQWKLWIKPSPLEKRSPRLRSKPNLLERRSPKKKRGHNQLVSLKYAKLRRLLKRNLWLKSRRRRSKDRKLVHHRLVNAAWKSSKKLL